jgi:uncharacterized membrane protein YdjX (TVP38/TMEM64 family)
VDDVPGEPAREGAGARPVLSAAAAAGRWRLAAGALAAAALLLLGRALDAPALLGQALDAIRGLGPWGPVLFVPLYVVATVLFLPGVVLTLGAGAVFGVLRGTITVSIAATLGATAAFLVGRYLARDAVARRIEASPRFRALDEAVAGEGWKIVGLARLSPVFPFNVLNYAFGVTRVPLRDFVLASWVGMLPGTVMYVYIGSVAGELATLGAADRARTPAEWAFYGVGLAATVAVTVVLTRLARRALARRVHARAEAAG